MKNKKTAKEIKEAKSLRWLANQFPKVENPKDNGDRLCNCINLYCTNAAELIEQQAVEIKRLKEKNENLRDSLVKKRFKDEMFEITLKEYTDGKIKEFAERLKEKKFELNDIYEKIFYAVDVEDIDNLLKELPSDGQ